MDVDQKRINYKTPSTLKHDIYPNEKLSYITMQSQESIYAKETHPIYEINSTNANKIYDKMSNDSYFYDHTLSFKNVSEFIEVVNLKDSDILHNINI